MQKTEFSIRQKACSLKNQAKCRKPGCRRGRPFITIGLVLIAVCTMLCNCNSKSSRESSTKFDQYFVQGEQLYLRHCSNCHQKNGKGLGLIYPPLDTSDYMQDKFEEVICLIRNGKSGVLVVNGKSFNQAMPGIPTLSDLEIAEIATYIYNSWSHDRGIVDVKIASQILASCDSLARP